MADALTTRPSLLIRVRDARDDEAWRQFVEIYGPAIYRFARKRGLQDADAADVTQKVLEAVSRAIKRFDYDPRQGTFRGWLFGVVRNQLGKFAAGQKKVVQASGDTGVHEVLDHQQGRKQEPISDEETLWDKEYQRQLFAWGVDRVRGCFEETSWRAFWLTAVDGTSARETADKLGMSIGAVYTAKSRVLDRIRKEIQQIQQLQLE
jgi:RNA polymerase sigma-70 factor (ECF subfamily)